MRFVFSLRMRFQLGGFHSIPSRSLPKNFFYELLGETNFSRRMSGRSAVNGDGKNMSDYKNHGFYIHISHTR